MLPKRLDRKKIYESPWINLYADRVVMPSGEIVEKYHFLDYPKESVVALLINKDNQVCFLKSLRYTTQRIEWELPAGNIESNEDALRAAEREVQEETGFKSKALKLFYTFNPSNGISNQVIHVALCSCVEDQQVKFDTDEVKEVHWLSVKQIKSLILNNEINDGISLIPVLLFLGGVRVEMLSNKT